MFIIEIKPDRPQYLPRDYSLFFGFGQWMQKRV